MKERIIIDCDTGQDDAIALMLAFSHEQIHVEGIVSVAGNVGLSHTLRNNLQLVNELNLDIPVYRGSEKPLLRDPVIAKDIHGESGLLGYEFHKKLTTKSQGNGIDFIMKTVQENPGEITVVATGPLTDIALAFAMEPTLPSNIKQLVLMGGSMGRGNVTSSAEFNIYADPEAASKVFSSNAKIIMMGLDVTQQVIVTDEVMERLRNEQQNNPKIARGLFLSGMKEYRKMCSLKFQSVAYMHDPNCLCYLIDPSLYQLTDVHIAVETKGQYTCGRTVALPDETPSNTQMATHVNVEAFWNIVSTSFEKLL